MGEGKCSSLRVHGRCSIGRAMTCGKGKHSNFVGNRGEDVQLKVVQEIDLIKHVRVNI
jgi:hypothetical protein